MIEQVMVRMHRNFAGIPFSPAIDQGERNMVESTVKTAMIAF